jgi:hypothetical protein
LEACRGFVWLDNEALFCTTQNKVVVSQNAEIINFFPMKSVNASKVDVPAILRGAGEIYHLEWENYKNKLLGSVKI